MNQFQSHHKELLAIGNGPEKSVQARLAENNIISTTEHGNFTVHNLSMPGLKLIEYKTFTDERGSFSEIFSPQLTEILGVSFVQGNESVSNEGVLRGLHYQLFPFAQGKLVRVTSGAVLDVAVDIQVGSPTFGQYIAVKLTAGDNKLYYLPGYMAHGFLSLQNNTIFSYLVTAPYNKSAERSIIWEDPAINIKWELLGGQGVDMVSGISSKDKEAQQLSELSQDDLPAVTKEG